MKRLSLTHPAPVVLVVDDDEGHAILIQQNLQAAGLNNRFEHFSDGQAVLDFFYRRGTGLHSQAGETYLVLLDIRMPKVDGFEVLRRLKSDQELRRLPVIVLTTTDDPREVERCHELGCNIYIQKPVDYDRFAEVMQRLGLFLSLLLVPSVKG